jgi:HK97 family phage portal protein
MAAWWERLRDVLRRWADGFRGPVPVAPWITGADLGWSTSTTAATAATYGKIYRSQPAIRTVVEFLALNVAQVGLHLYQRISDTDRVRLRHHPAARILAQPNPYTTTFRLMRDTVTDLGVYGNAYWLKLRDQGSYELLRLPPEEVTPRGRLIPLAYEWQWPEGGHRVLLPPSEVIHFRHYAGMSPIEALRPVMAEAIAATEYRAAFWKNAARLSGWIQRPKDAPRWTAEQAQTFKQDIARYRPGNDLAGGTPVLEDGMEFVQNTATARDSQYMEMRKASREEAAALYHMPPAMVGLLDAQGYGSVREQHKALYQDALGPWFAMIEQELALQFLTDFADSEDLYWEYNISEKLQGSFEEQTDALYRSVGSAWMTRNEARARQNLPKIDDPDFDVPVTRLDVAEGQAAKPPEAT